jgi:hypothetical protein
MIKLKDEYAFGTEAVVKIVREAGESPWKKATGTATQKCN